MGFIAKLKAMLGGSSAPDFAGFDPDDVEAYWLADHEIDQAERVGDEALAAVFARYGLRNADHWEAVGGAICSRHQHNPDFAFASTRVQMRVQLAEMASQYQLPPGYLEPVEGIGLDGLALINAKVDRARPQGTAAVATVYQQHGLDEARFAHVDSTWKSRMGGQADAMAASILSGLYQNFVMQAQSHVEGGGAR